MKHSAWLQNRSPARALEGKTPYEVRYNKKPHLAGIQEFGVAGYVKDLQAGKLDLEPTKANLSSTTPNLKGIAYTGRQNALSALSAM